MSGRLMINSPISGDDEEVGLSGVIPISLTIAIADVREPDKRNSTFSKTITIPGTPEANKLFEHIFEVTTDLNNFNPNLKNACKYFVKGEKVFNGDIQLLSILKKGKSPTETINYEVSIIGRLSKAFLDLGNSLLTDLDFSDLNHTFNYSNRNWTPTIGTGYTYPLIDYGVNGGNNFYWDFAHLSPAIFENEYWSRIFSGINKTYTSSYISSTYSRSIQIPRTSEGALKMTASQINGVSFYAGRTTNTAVSNVPLGYVAGYGGWVHGLYPMPYGLPLTQFNDDSTTPFYDGGNNYSTVTSAFTTPIGFEMKINSTCNFRVRLNAPLTTNAYSLSSPYIMNIDIYIVGVAVIPASATFYPTINNYVDVTVSVSAPNVNVPANTLIYITNTIDPGITTFLNGITPVTSGSASIDCYMVSTSWFSATSSTGNLPIGYTVDMNQCVPKNVKQIDYIMSVIKSENLYMELDLTNDNNYIIEKRADFFLDNSQALNWTDKWAFREETKIVPMGELDWRKYLFAYKSDGDKFNKRYYDSFGETYGQKYVLVNNDFIKNEKKTELIFSATPMVGNTNTSLVYPLFAQVDGNNVKPMAVQIRRLYWGGTKQLLSGFYGMVNALNGASPTTLAIYPFAGSVDDPYTPTLSLDWGIPQMLYYAYPGQIWTTNNLYNRNYAKFIQQITNPNSKIVTMWLYLKASDIANFTFRKPVFIHDSYYLVNKIFDYNPQEVSLTKVELLRITYVADPITEAINIWDDGEGAVSGFQFNMLVNPNGNNPNGVNSEVNGVTSGENNINNGQESGIMGGEFNYIGGAYGY